MSVGSQSDIVARLQSYLPRRWFGDFSSVPVINGVLNGIASAMSLMYALIVYFQAQTRLQTSTDGWVDMWAADFFGTSLPRNTGESDAGYISRVQAEFLLRRATRPAMQQALTALTGRAPVIFEPSRPLDSGCLGKNQGANSFFRVARFGSIAAPYSALITVLRPIPRVLVEPGSAYFDAAATSAFHTPLSQGYFGNLAAETQAATDGDVYSVINATRPLATNIGVALTNH
jgi:hypothetical protein